MSITLYQASVPSFVRMLGNLSEILNKAAAHAEAKNIDPSIFMAMSSLTMEFFISF